MIVERDPPSRGANQPAARVFLVEDEPVIALELDDRLRELGYDVCGHARRAEEALVDIPASDADLVITDVNLAGAMTGFDLVARLRETSNVPVIFLTASDDIARMRAASDLGVFAYLTKPFGSASLRANVEQVLVRRAREPIVGAPVSPATGRVLFLDNEPLVVRVAVRLLGMLGYEGTGFVSPIDAIAAVRADPHRFDVVITDWTMPEMSGLDVARTLRAIRGDLRIGLTSGHLAAPTEELVRAGIHGVLEKPFALSQLAELLERLGKG